MIGNRSTKHKAWNLLIAAVLALPSAWLLAQNSDLPAFGRLHDDSVYFVSAKSLAAGNGYRIESLPGAPSQTKYPPLYPFLLSVAWKVTPEYPANLPVAAWLSWLALPLLLIQLAWIFSRLGFSGWRIWTLLALFGLNPYVISFSAMFLLSELWFLVFVVASLLAVEHGLDRRSAKWIVLAGLLAGFAYLRRSAGLAFFAAAAVYLWVRKQPKLAVVFSAAGAPFVIAWMLWVRWHQVPTADPELMYYTDYFRYRSFAIANGDLPVMLWKNVDAFLAGLGGLILPKLSGSLFEKIVAQVIAVAMLSGVVRLMRRGFGQLFGWFAALSAILLIVWHFPPDERLVLPLFPLALAGLLVEAEHFASLLRASRQHKDRSQRVVAVGMMAAASLFAAALLGLQAYVGAVLVPQDAARNRALNVEREAVHRWLAENTPVDAGVLSTDDVTLYLSTGRHAMRRQLRPFLWYREDHAGTVSWLAEPASYARGHGLSYFDFLSVDVSLGIESKDSAAIQEKIAASGELELLMHQGKTNLYAIRPQDSASAELHPRN